MENERIDWNAALERCAQYTGLRVGQSRPSWEAWAVSLNCKPDEASVREAVQARSQGLLTIR